MAQDFYATFGLGTDDRYISAVDMEGVALAAIQGVNQIVNHQANQIAAQQHQIAMLNNEVVAQRAQIAAIEARLSALEQNKTTTAPVLPGSPAEWLLFSSIGVIALFTIQQAIRQGKRSS
jgi:hypothetical protein